MGLCCGSEAMAAPPAPAPLVVPPPVVGLPAVYTRTPAVGEEFLYHGSLHALDILLSNSIRHSSNGSTYLWQTQLQAVNDNSKYLTKGPDDEHGHYILDRECM